MRRTESTAMIALLLICGLSTHGTHATSSPHRPSLHGPFHRAHGRAANHRTPAALRVPRGGGTSAVVRGGAAIAVEERDDDGDEGEEEEILRKELAERAERMRQVRRYRLEQQHLIEMRSTFLAEALASRGVPVGPTMVDVTTPEGKKPPTDTDWDCSLSTAQDPKSCLYSFDAEPNTKVISPTGTTQHISLSALNRLRRTDPTKVEPMWHSRYSILHSWFSDSSPHSLLQHLPPHRYLTSTLLLDAGSGLLLRALLLLALSIAVLAAAPIGEYVVGRALVSGGLWRKWGSWGRFVHAGMPMKIIIGQMLWRGVAGGLLRLEGCVRDFVVELECGFLEECVPITVGDGGDDGDDYIDEDDM